MEGAELDVHGQALTRLALFMVQTCASIRTVEAGDLVSDANLFGARLGDPDLAAALAACLSAASGQAEAAGHPAPTI